jgi:hypothetical protein
LTDWRTASTRWVNEDLPERREDDDVRRLLSEQQTILNKVLDGIAYLKHRSCPATGGCMNSSAINPAN